jgi:hypothetical protein
MTQDWLTILVLAATGPVAAFVALHAYARWSIRHIDDPQTDGHDYVDTDLVDGVLANQETLNRTSTRQEI